MMTAVDGGEPDPDHDQGEQRVAPSCACLYSIIKDDQGIGCMQGGHGCEYIGAFRIERGEYGYMEELVEAAQAGSVAGGMGVKPESVLLYIPGWSGGVHVVDDEAQYIDCEKSKGETEKSFFILVKKVTGEGQW